VFDDVACGVQQTMEKLQRHTADKLFKNHNGIFVKALGHTFKGDTFFSPKMYHIRRNIVTRYKRKDEDKQRVCVTFSSPFLLQVASILLQTA
jgi:hypothetical protein